jgi:AraC-like DNA-binding protein
MNELQDRFRRLADTIARLMPDDGVLPLGDSGVSVIRSSGATPAVHYGVKVASVCVVAQGSKRLYLATEVVEYDESHIIVSTIDVPVASRLIRATPGRPFLCVRLGIDPARVAELAPRVFKDGIPFDETPETLALVLAEPGMLDAVTRLVEACAGDADTAGLFGPMAYDEFLLHLLRSPVGPRIARSSQTDSAPFGVAQAVSWLRNHFSEPVTVDGLAERAYMSVSSFHEHFKAVTHLSPMQYLKAIRLQTARGLMLDRQLQASEAATSVGYVSASQFSRDYRRYFGDSPAHDVHGLRERPLGADFEVAPILG